jgi:hypothetical protein
MPQLEKRVERAGDLEVGDISWPHAQSSSFRQTGLLGNRLEVAAFSSPH